MWTKFLWVLAVYVACGLVFFAALSILLAKEKENALRINFAILLFLVMYVCLNQLLHKIIETSNTFYVRVDDVGNKVDFRNAIALILAGASAFIIVQFYNSHRKK